MPPDNTVVMEGVRIIFRNFKGEEGKYNREGERNFCVLLDDTIANAMADDGWNVKTLRPREDDEEDTVPQSYLPVSINFKIRPPRVIMITSRGGTELSEDTIARLDWVDIKNVDLIVRPYLWNVGDRSGITAYLQSLYVTIEEDTLEQKYADILYQSQNPG
jgi:hypothetical protein